MQTTVIHIRDSKNVEDEVYIGRAGKGQTGYFGNPIIKGEFCLMCGSIHNTPGDTLPCFEQYAKNMIKYNTEYRNRVEGLKGKKLVCFCAPRACHGDVLAKLAEELSNLK